MNKQTLTRFEKYGKMTRQAKFLADLDRIILWPEMTAAVATIYPNIKEQGGPRQIPLEWKLRIYFLQLCFNSDPAVEEELYDSAAMRSFVRIDLGVVGAPDETKICSFRHLLERNKLSKVLPPAVNEHLHRNGIKISNVTVVEATIIGASQQDEADPHDPGVGRERAACAGEVSLQPGKRRGSARQSPNWLPKHRRCSSSTLNAADDRFHGRFLRVSSSLTP